MTKCSADLLRATLQKSTNPSIVHLDTRKDQAFRKGDCDNKYPIIIEFAEKVHLATVRAYSEGKVDFDDEVLEGMLSSMA